MESKKKNTLSCGCFVVRSDRGHIEVLLVKPFMNRDSWGIPKGHIDEGESPEQCALREVKEETGLDVHILCEMPQTKTTNKNENKTVRTFFASLPKDQPIVLDSENAEVKWFPITELPAIHKYQIEVIEAAKTYAISATESFGPHPHTI